MLHSCATGDRSTEWVWLGCDKIGCVESYEKETSMILSQIQITLLKKICNEIHKKI